MAVKFKVAGMLAAILLVSSCASTLSKTISTQSQPLKVATWNMEHFAFPINNGCRPRSEQEITQIRQYLKSVNADIYAVEEVSSVEALRQVFPEDQWNIIFSQRPDSESYECRGSGYHSTQQKVGLVLRKNIEVEKSTQQSEFGLDNPGLRYGVSATVKTSFGPLTILALHLKSGCFVDDYSSSDKQSCQTLAQQVPQLTSWIKQQETKGTPYMFLGDFNHRLSAPYNRFTREINASKSASSQLRLVTQPLLGCHPRYPAPIDHIWVGGMPTTELVSHTAVYPFSNMDEDAMLSDHCAVSVEFPAH
ncbi:endonuclease/exonuclease/phosphatase family protein [Neptunicella marina]|uniref:Endonuclease/exonuclease/phosphatase family protein n=1 Tax=Neptunicella marina TaxID=2125989 RepID=A0A8J6INH3_9ALTE|nr:endonuclease/exonuclease/phosphatase family protein [Neptunicella marina]MBC3765220.1 endonuclease/exonuclease/phosphatase family protein [Neptunicella marina]